MSAPGTPPQLRDRYGLSAGWKYSSGRLHAAWDIPTPTGTPLLAGVHGTVRDISDGTHNNRPGHNPGSGAPSNWVLIWTTVEGKPATIYYQHLSPGVTARPGMTVTPNTVIGHTGNSGNSTGPHLHLSTQWGHVEPWNRYADLNNQGKTTIWPPDRAFTAQPQQEGDDDMTPEQAKTLDDVAWLVQQIKGQTDHIYPRMLRPVDDSAWLLSNSVVVALKDISGRLARVEAAMGLESRAAPIPDTPTQG